ncbi:hypothetical protein [Phaeobacter sp.]|uniref:hypothetical protein n=1 Tax=Phaeobacter sp. TaxID=1902409 RepID=UPI0025D4DA6D|nr:hypothetical protein [Phaeobacter sp.]
MYKFINACITLAALICLWAFQIGAAQAQGSSNVIIVFDASGSMWGQINGVTKIEIAREAFANVQAQWNDILSVIELPSFDELTSCVKTVQLGS